MEKNPLRGKFYALTDFVCFETITDVTSRFFHHTTANATTPTLTHFPSNFGCVLDNSGRVADRSADQGAFLVTVFFCSGPQMLLTQCFFFVQCFDCQRGEKLKQARVRVFSYSTQTTESNICAIYSRSSPGLKHGPRSPTRCASYCVNAWICARLATGRDLASQRQEKANASLCARRATESDLVHVIPDEKREVEHEMANSVIFVIACGHDVFGVPNRCNKFICFFSAKLFLELVKNFACNHFV